MRPSRSADQKVALGELGVNVVAQLVHSSATVCGRRSANSRLPLYLLKNGGKPCHADQAALSSIAVAAARRSILPSELRGTASTANSRSGAL